MTATITLQRDRILQPFIGTTALFAGLFIIVCYVINYQSGLWIMSACFLIFLLTLFLFKNNYTSYLLTSNLYLLNCTLTVALLSVFHSGGIFSPFLITYIMLSVIAVLLLGQSKTAWAWMFTFLTIILVIGIFHHFNTEFEIKYDQSYSIFFYIACLTGVPACTFYIAFIFEKETKHTFDLLRENQALQISNEEKDLLIREIHHRVKNNLQIISSLVNLQINELTDEKTIDILNVTRSRIFALSLIHQKLFTGANTGTVNFKEHLNDLLSAQQRVFIPVESSVSGSDVDLELDIATPLSLIISELISNAFKHAFKGVKDPRIDINIVKLEEPNYKVILKDNGVGAPKDFDFDKSNSLGLEIIRSLVSQVDGSIEFHSSANGTEVWVTFSTRKISSKIK